MISLVLELPLQQPKWLLLQHKVFRAFPPKSNKLLLPAFLPPFLQVPNVVLPVPRESRYGGGSGGGGGSEAGSLQQPLLSPLLSVPSGSSAF